MDYIDDLCEEASFHSSSVFTLAFSASRSRFRTLAQADPEGFLRLAVQAALAAHAEQVDIALDVRTCEVQWQSHEPWTLQDLEHLHAYLSGQNDVFASRALQLAKLGCLLTGCRPDLRLVVSVAGRSQALQLDSDGPVWVCVEVRDFSAFCFERVGEKPAENRAEWGDLKLWSPHLTSCWPEISRLLDQFHDPSARLNLCARPFGPTHPFSVSVLRPQRTDARELFRCAIVHPDSERNNLCVASGENRRPFSWLEPKIFTCCQLDGTPIHVPPRSRVRAYAGFALFNRTLERKVEWYVFVPADSGTHYEDHLLAILKYGTMLYSAQDPLPGKMRAVIDGSDLPTDISSRKAVQGPELAARQNELLDLVVVAALSWRNHLNRMGRWSRFLTSEHVEGLRYLQERLHLFTSVNHPQLVPG